MDAPRNISIVRNNTWLLKRIILEAVRGNMSEFRIFTYFPEFACLTLIKTICHIDLDPVKFLGSPSALAGVDKITSV